jgi:MFS family permease
MEAIRPICSKESTMRRPLPPTAALVVTSALFAAFFVAAGAPTPLLSLRQQEWGFSDSALTLAFAVYALALLVALLAGGSLSDHLGRRPVLLLALGLELGSMLLFLVAPDIVWVVVARVVQGVATGLATSAFTVAIGEHAPAHLRTLAGAVAAAAVAGGLGVGALLTGAAVQLAPDANTLVFSVLAAVMAVGMVLVLMVAETGRRRPGAMRSLVPTFSLARAAHPELRAALPVLVAAWMVPAFFLGLSPALLRGQFDHDGGLVAGFTAFLGPFAAALAGFWFSRHHARRSAVVGTALVLLGMVVVLGGVVAVWLPVVWVGAVLGGLGFGGAFGGTIRLVVPLVQEHERAGVVTAVYTVAYLAFSLPVVLAGRLSPHWGLVPTSELYVVLVIALAATALVTQALAARRVPVPAVPARA